MSGADARSPLWTDGGEHRCSAGGRTRPSWLHHAAGSVAPPNPRGRDARLALPVARAHSSAGERSLHTREVPGSIPGAPTSPVAQPCELAVTAAARPPVFCPLLPKASEGVQLTATRRRSGQRDCCRGRRTPDPAPTGHASTPPPASLDDRRQSQTPGHFCPALTCRNNSPSPRWALVAAASREGRNPRGKGRAWCAGTEPGTAAARVRRERRSP
jgi:hypothetical protein